MWNVTCNIFPFSVSITHVTCGTCCLTSNYRYCRFILKKKCMYLIPVLFKGQLYNGRKAEHGPCSYSLEVQWRRQSLSRPFYYDGCHKGKTRRPHLLRNAGTVSETSFEAELRRMRGSQSGKGGWVEMIGKALKGLYEDTEGIQSSVGGQIEV